MPKNNLSLNLYQSIDWDNVKGNLPVRMTNDYLFRSFASINTGEEYDGVKPAVQIGILNFTLFKNEPEFYATYYMLNEKTHRPYSDKLRLSVLNLKQLELATEEDMLYGIDLWAKLFKATTWEELKMLANSDPDMQEAVVTVCQLTMEQKIRQRCEAREDYYCRTAGRERLLKESLAENERLVSENKQLISENEELASKNKKLQQKLTALGIDIQDDET